MTNKAGVKKNGSRGSFNDREEIDGVPIRASFEIDPGDSNRKQARRPRTKKAFFSQFFALGVGRWYRLPKLFSGGTVQLLLAKRPASSPTQLPALPTVAREIRCVRGNPH